MKMKRILSLTLAFSMMFTMPVMAKGTSAGKAEQGDGEVTEQESFKEQKPGKLSEEEFEEVFGKENLQAASENSAGRSGQNNTPETAYPYSSIPTMCTTITNNSDLYRLERVLKFIPAICRPTSHQISC